MKKYIGTGIMNVYCAIGFLILELAMLGVSAFFILCTFSVESTLFGSFCFLSAAMIFYMIAIRARGLEQFYGIGHFDEKGFTIKIPFMRKKYIEYAKCKELGIAYYVHGAGQSGELGYGTYCFYIYFTYGVFDEKYRSRIGQWRITRTNAKIGFDKELYDYLVSVLPENQADILRHDYARLNVGKKRKIWETKL